MSSHFCDRSLLSLTESPMTLFGCKFSSQKVTSSSWGPVSLQKWKPRQVAGRDSMDLTSTVCVLCLPNLVFPFAVSAPCLISHLLGRDVTRGTFRSLLPEPRGAQGGQLCHWGVREPLELSCPMHLVPGLLSPCSPLSSPPWHWGLLSGKLLESVHSDATQGFLCYRAT